LIDWSAQCIVRLDVSRIEVFTAATNTGRWTPSGGHDPGASGFTTRAKKYAVKNDPNSITSDAMKRNMPSTAGVTREL
jgi:hypothetical protein